MDNTQTPPAWETLAKIVETSNRAEVLAFLKTLPADDKALVLSRLSHSGQARLLANLSPEQAVELIGLLPEVEAVDVVANLTPQTAAAIVEELPSNEQADLVGGLEHAAADAILAELPSSMAEVVASLVRYSPNTAGGLMFAEFLSYPEDMTIGDAVDDLRRNAQKYRGYAVQYAFVVDRDGALTGVLALRDLLLADPSRELRQMMTRHPLAVSVSADLLELQDFFAQHQFVGVPVSNDAGELVGVVRRSAVEEALADQNASDYRRSQGIVQEELRTMPLFQRSRRRLAWLSINIVLNILAASVIAFYQDTLAQVIALAVFLPIISDMSGCSGGQAVAVSMRELSLGLLRPTELARVWGKEILVGLVNGLALGVLIASAAWAWQGNPFLGLVVGAAMALNTIIAVSLGGTLPLAIKRLGLDPALASGPILTTITDMCGFFLILSLAAAFLPLLT
jgi:magnesium transporter